MARTEITKTKAPGSYSHTGSKLTKTAADPTNQNSYKATGREIVVAQNTDTVSHTVTITSVQDPYNRTEDIASYSIPAGETHIFGPFQNTGWIQPDGYVYLEADDATVEFGIIQL